MRSLLALCLVFVFVATASADIVDNFDSYADQAAFDAVYGAGGMTLDQAKGYSDGQSMSNASRAGNLVDWGVGNGYIATDASPLTFTAMVDVDNIHWWTRNYIGMYAYGAGDPDPVLQDLFMLGFNSSGDSTRYHSRGGDGYVWASIDDLSGDTVFERTTEWRELKAIVTSTTVEFYVDGVLGRSVTRPAGTEDVVFNKLLLGTTYSSQEDVWWDDLSITGTYVPEPAALVLLALGSLMATRRR